MAGDQGRDFETFRSFVAEPGDIGRRLGLDAAAPVAFACTLQQSDLRRKILTDVGAVMGGPAVELVVVYAEAAIPVGSRHAIEEEARKRWEVEVAVFDGSAIAEELAFRRAELGDAIQRYLDVADMGARTVPRRLPPAPQVFVNREPELAQLDGVLALARDAPGPRIAVLSGMHGVGKSATASHWSNAVRERFSDGDLYLDFGPRIDPSAPDVEEALGQLLRDLGAAAIPDGLKQRRRLFESLTASKQLLMMVDNVEEPAQVLATLPVGGGSMVVVTSNRRLEELVFEGARLVEVDPLSERDGVRLLAEMAGPGVIEGSDPAPAELVSLCGGLPIAVAVCGASLALRRGMSVGELARSVWSAPDRLAALSGPGRFSVASVFEVAYQALSEGSALVYRRMGLWRGPTFRAPLVAALAGTGPEDAAACLVGLEEAHLVNRVGDDRFDAHVLVSLHMSSVAASEEAQRDKDHAVSAAVDWIYGVARIADFAVTEDRLRLTGGEVGTVLGAPELSSPADAYRWFGLERHNVMAAIEAAVELGMAERVWQFAEALWPLCATQKRFAEWVRSHRLAVEAAVTLDDPVVDARVRSQLARAYAELGDHHAAAAEMATALEAAERGDNPRLVASVKEFAGVCALAAESYRDALKWLTQARLEAAELGSSRGAALADYYASRALVHLGNPSRALELLRRAESTFIAVGDEVNVGRVGVRRSGALLDLGRIDEAMTEASGAVELLERLGLDFELAEIHEALASASAFRGWETEARRYRQRAYQLYRQMAHPRADALEAELGAAS